MKQTLVSYLIIASIFASASNGEFQVNTRPAYDQTYADIAMDANGNFVVVWSSYYSYGSKSNEIRGRRFAAGGSPIDANEFEINTVEAGNQKEPSVAMDAVGNFVVVWQGPGEDQNDIFAQRFDANGQVIGGEFRVNSNTIDEQLSPSVAMNDSGSFIIVWESDNVPEAGKRAICAQCYNNSDMALGSEIVVNDEPSICRYPDVALTNSGQAIVVWVKQSATYSIWSNHFPADGNSPELLAKKVNESPNFASLTIPSICVDSAGNHVIAWDGHSQNHNEDDIYIKAYHWTHAPWHNQYIVTTAGQGAQRNPSVAISDEGWFIVVWEGDCSDGTMKRNIFDQRFTIGFDWPTEPNRLGDESTLNTYIVNEQRYPTVAIRENGEFVTVWQSNGQDGSGYGIFGQIGPKVGSADFTGDGFVNFRDYCILAQDWLKAENPLTADLIDDNKIDQRDLNVFCDQWLSFCYDCNDVDIYTDGKIDFKDYCLWAQGYLQQGPLKGDITGDGTVDWADLKALTLHWAKTCEQ